MVTRRVELRDRSICHEHVNIKEMIFLRNSRTHVRQVVIVSFSSGCLHLAIGCLHLCGVNGVDVTMPRCSRSTFNNRTPLQWVSTRTESAVKAKNVNRPVSYQNGSREPATGRSDISLNEAADRQLTNHGCPMSNLIAVTKANVKRPCRLRLVSFLIVE